MLMVALRMAEQREAMPSAIKPSKEFRQTVRIGSASSWDKNILSLFHVAFDQATTSDIQLFLDPKYFQPPAADEDCYNGRHFRNNINCRI
jgi:hypothetical protein